MRLPRLSKMRPVSSASDIILVVLWLLFCSSNLAWTASKKCTFDCGCSPFQNLPLKDTSPT